MIKSKKQMFIVIAAFTLILLLGTTTYAFFNYTRKGSANTIKVGRIAFNSEQGSAINLTNIFPIDRADIDTETDYVGSVSIHVTGDTTYSDGIEYLVSVEDLQNTVNNKSMPIALDISYTANNSKTIGENDSSYYNNRGGNTSRYKILKDRIISDYNNKILVGYIAPGQSGIDGTITIKAFIDKDKIAISDTYPSGIKRVVNPNMTTEEYNNCVTYYDSNYYFNGDETAENYCLGTGTYYQRTFQERIDIGYENSHMNYLLEHNIVKELGENGTTENWVNGRAVFTTEEWNTLGESGLSFKIKVEANEGIWAGKPGNVMGELSFLDGNTYYVKEIYFNDMDSEEMHQRYEAATIKDDLTYNNDGEVLCWLETNSEDNTRYNMYVASDGETIFTTGRSLFYVPGYTRIDKLEFNNVNTSMVTDMSNMFYGQNALKNIDITNFDTSNVITMRGFVYNTSSVESVNMEGLDLRKVQDMSAMFQGNFKLKEVNLDGVKVRDIVNMGNMFYQSDKIEHLNLDNWGGDNLEVISWSTFSIDDLKTISMKNFNFGKATSMDTLFQRLENLESVDLSGIKMDNVTSIVSTFRGCTSLENVNMSNAGSSVLNSISSMFAECSNLKNVNFNGFNFGNAYLGSLFSGLTNLESVDLSETKINSGALASLFDGCSKLTNVNFDNAEFVGLENVYSMFKGCSMLETVDLSSIDFSDVITTVNMFSGCSSLKTIKVANGTDLSNTQNDYNMFYDCTSLVGGNGTTYDDTHVGKEYAIIDGANDLPGYFTLKTN